LTRALNGTIIKILNYERQEMSSVNKAIILGNLGADPVLRYSQDGKPFASFSVATTEKWKSKDGENKEHTEWHRISAIGKQAELVSEYLKKGSKVYLEGKIKTRKFKDDDGIEKYAVEIIMDKITFLSKSNIQSDDDFETKPTAKSGSEAIKNMDDDIPF